MKTGQGLFLAAACMALGGCNTNPSYVDIRPEGADTYRVFFGEQQTIAMGPNQERAAQVLDPKMRLWCPRGFRIVPGSYGDRAQGSPASVVVQCDPA